MIGRLSMSSDLYKFKLVSYGKSEGLKHAKQFVANGATKKGICDKLDKEADFYLRVAHEVWQFEANEMDDTDTNNLLAEYE